MTSPGCTSPSSVWVWLRLSFLYSGKRWRRLLVAYTKSLSAAADMVPSSTDFSAL